MMFAARAVVSAVLVVILIIYPLASPASNDLRVCTNSSISIKADEMVDHDDICNSAEDALEFFDRLNIALTHPLVIQVVLNLQNWMSEAAVGCYHNVKRRGHANHRAFTHKGAAGGVGGQHLTGKYARDLVIGIQSYV